MRTWIIAALLVGCPASGPTDETDIGTDTDTDTDSDTEALTLVLDLSDDEIVVEPGKSKTRPFYLDNAPIDVDVIATPDIEGCVETDITGVAADEPVIQITGSSSFLGRCNLTVEASGGGQSDTVVIPIAVDVDWEGKVLQWGGPGVNRLGSLASTEGKLFLGVSEEGDETGSVGLERRDAWGSRIGAASVEGESWIGGALAVGARGQKSWVAAYDSDDDGWVIPFDGDLALTPLRISADGGLLPTSIEIEADKIRVVGETRNKAGQQGIVFASWDLDGANPSSSAYFPPQDGIRPLAVVRTDEGWITAGLAYGTPFPEVENNIEWGSYIARFDTDGALQDVQRVGVENTQIYGLEIMPDGGLLISGFVRNVDLDGNPSGSRYDGFMRRYDADGSVAWTRIVGTEEGDERLRTLSILDGVAIGAGQNEDAGWAIGVDIETGELLWEKTWGSTNTGLSSAAVHGLGVVLGGYTAEELVTPLSGVLDNVLLRVGADGEPR